MDEFATRAADPATSAADLAQIAAQRPDLWVQISAHPNAYPGLLDWMSQYGDETVKAAVAARLERNTHPPVLPAPPVQSGADTPASDAPSAHDPATAPPAMPAGHNASAEPAGVDRGPGTVGQGAQAPAAQGSGFGPSAEGAPPPASGPAKKRRIVLIVVLSIVGALLLAGAAIGGVALVRTLTGASSAQFCSVLAEAKQFNPNNVNGFDPEQIETYVDYFRRLAASAPADTKPAYEAAVDWFDAVMDGDTSALTDPSVFNDLYSALSKDAAACGFTN